MHSIQAWMCLEISPYLAPVHDKRKNPALTSAATVVVGLLKENTNVQSPAAKPSEALSPGKRARVSGQYLEHLERHKALKKSGVLSD